MPKLPRPHSTLPRLRRLYALLVVLLLLLPAAGVVFFRAQEQMLIRQTERELIAQATVIASNYRAALERSVPDTTRYGLPLPDDFRRYVIDGFYTPIYPKLDLHSTQILPPRPIPEDTLQAADPYGSVAGKTLTPLLQDVQRSLLSGLLVLDYRGIIVAGQTGVDFSLTEAEEVQAALTGEYRSVLRQRENMEPSAWPKWLARTANLRVFAAYPVIHNRHVWGVVYVSQTPTNILKQIEARKDWLLFTGLLWLLFTGLTAWYIRYRVILPVRRLRQQVEAAIEGTPELVVTEAKAGCAEYADLAQQLATLSAMLRERTEYIRTFASHVSDEFVQPLSEIRESADNLVEHLDDADPEEKRRLLNTITKDTLRLQSLTKRLQELAEADSLTPRAEAICYIMPILMRLQDRYQAEGLEVIIEGDSHCDTMMEADHFESIIDKLLENAKQHGATRVTITLTLDEQELTIRLHDNGEGIEDSRRTQIFLPFFSTQRKNGGTGLGLGIVRALATAYRGTVSAEKVKEGARFKLVLPANQ